MTMRMKKGFLLMLMMGAAVACSTLTPAEKEALAKRVNTALDERKYEINVQMMSPLKGPGKNLTSGWSLEVKNDSLFSYLPYMGRAYNVPFGGGKGLNFDAPIKNYRDGLWQKNLRKIDFDATNEENTYHYTIDVYENGNATINVVARERDPITFSGVMKEETEK